MACYSWLWPLEELAALSKGVGSSSASGLIICAMTGWFCLFCMILVMAWMKALGASTKAFASASGRSNTMAMSISPPSFLIRASLPACIRSRIATALFSHRFVPTLLQPVVPVIPFVVGPFGLLGFPAPRGMHYRAMWQRALLQGPSLSLTS